jgi:hypothetical protein
VNRAPCFCSVCGAFYDDPETARACAAAPAEPEEIAVGALVEVTGEQCGPGWVVSSFLLGVGDPRGATHERLYRARFLWGQADFHRGQLLDRGPATEAEWRAALGARASRPPIQ